MTDLKAAFEAWVREYDGSTEMAEGQYIDDEVNACWVAYRVAHAAALDAAAGVVEGMRTNDLFPLGTRTYVVGEIRALAEKEVSDGAE